MGPLEEVGLGEGSFGPKINCVRTRLHDKCGQGELGMNFSRFWQATCGLSLLSCASFLLQPYMVTFSLIPPESPWDGSRVTIQGCHSSGVDEGCVKTSVSLSVDQESPYPSPPRPCPPR